MCVCFFLGRGGGGGGGGGRGVGGWLSFLGFWGKGFKGVGFLGASHP